MSRLVFDIEGDDLLFHMTQIHCLVTQDADTKEISKYPPDRLGEGIASLRGAECLIGHNIIGYDLPAIWKIFGNWDHFPLIVDTLVISRHLFPERYGGHGLAAWGERLGYPKLDFDDYENYSEEMLTYCTRDVSLNLRVLQELEKEAEEVFTGFKVYSCLN
jgi:DNA polymerase-1